MRNILTLLLLLAALCACSAERSMTATALRIKPSPSPSKPVTSPTPNCNLQNFTSGVDVSDYQPDTDWLTANQNGAQFSFIKATEGVTIINADFVSDWAATKAAGVLRSAYHFFHPADDPAQAAITFLDIVGATYDGDLPPMIDWETSDGLPAVTVIANAQTWLDAVETATGQTPIIYTDPNYWSTLGNPAAFARYPLFVADYVDACPQVPPPWKTWTFWQYGQGAIGGIRNLVDLDFFNGSLATLEDF